MLRAHFRATGAVLARPFSPPRRGRARRRRHAGRPRVGPSGGRRPVRPSYASRPDLTPPVVEVSTALPTAASGYVFLAPSAGPQLGPLIVDDTGEPVWFRPLPLYSNQVAHNFRVQTYRGRPVLTWWEGDYADGYGQGEYVVLDSSYAEVARFGAGNGYAGDLHEFTITPDDTALDQRLQRRRRRPLVLRRSGRRDAARRRRPGDPHRERRGSLRVAQRRPRRRRRVLPAGHRRYLGLLPPQLDRPARRRQPPHLRPPHVDDLQARPADGRDRLAARRQEERLRHGRRDAVRLPARRPRSRRRRSSRSSTTAVTPPSRRSSPSRERSSCSSTPKR